MRKGPELFISWRYFATRRKEAFISLIGVIAVLGIAIGVTALIVVIAVMTGFDRDLHAKIVGNYSHLVISRLQPMDRGEYEKVSRIVSAHPQVAGLSPYVSAQALLKEGGRFFAVSLRGIEPQTEGEVTKIASYLKEGSLRDLGEKQLLLGAELAAYLGAKKGASLTLYSPEGKAHALTVAGIFQSGMYEYDMNLVFTTAATAQGIFGMSGTYSAVAVKLRDLYRAERVARELMRQLDFDYSVRTWMQINRTFFAALKLEKLTMFIILALIILVASFNIISTLVVLAVNKTKDIGILKALGMSAAGIRRIFIHEGLLIGGIGTGLGTAGGVGLALLLKRYQFVKLPSDIYYIDRLPVALEVWPDLVLIVGASLAIAFCATLYPAARASRLQPVEALRYE